MLGAWLGKPAGWTTWQAWPGENTDVRSQYYMDYSEVFWFHKEGVMLNSLP